MRLVLPTDWSPRSTILVFLRGDEVNSEVAGVVGDAMIVEMKTESLSNAQASEL